MIRQYFSSVDASAILSIPLGSRLPADRLVWAYNPKGLFTVKSAYKVAFATTLVKRQATRITNSFGEQSGGLIFQTKSSPFCGEQARIYYQQKSICVVEKTLMTQSAKHVGRELKVVGIFSGIVLRLMRFGNLLVFAHRMVFPSFADFLLFGQ